jgi:ADP-ribosylglycohydrolase
MWPSPSPTPAAVRARFEGCLLGGAVGDALGAAVEFLSRAGIEARFGPRGITRYAPAYGGLGRITDDTQMTLFTAEGLLRAWVCGKAPVDYPEVVAHAYLRWLATQGERSALPVDETGWLFQHPDLHNLRAPGNTCLAALRNMRQPGAAARNDSKGCGGVMRVAPVGLFCWRLRDRMSPDEAFHLGANLAGLTHGHPTGSLTAGAFAVVVMALTDGAPLRVALAAAMTCLREAPHHEETLDALERAQALAEAAVAPGDAIPQRGEGWVAEEALSIAVYCALVARDIEEGVGLAVSHDGDSDSTGAIAGNLLGALHGVRAIPEAWLVSLELRQVVEEIANDLYGFRDWALGERSERARILRKYPGG